MPHSSPVCGCHPHPIVFRRPRAWTLRSVPSIRMRRIVACSGFVSTQALHELPMAT